MTHWFQVFRYEVRQQFRRKAYLFVTFGVPLLIIGAFFGYQFYQDQTGGDAEDEVSTPVSEINDGNGAIIGYVDQTPDGLFPDPASYPPVNCGLSDTEQQLLESSIRLTNVFTNALKRTSSPYCSAHMIRAYATFEAGRAALEGGAIDNFVVIEADYMDSGNVSVYVDKINLDAMDSEQFFSDFLLRTLLYQVDDDSYAPLYLRLRDPATVVNHRLTAAGVAETNNVDQNMVLIYVFGLLSMLGIFWGGGYLMQSVVQEKESRIIEIVMSSVQPLALLFGKLLAMGLTALLQIGTIGATLIVLGTRASDQFDSLKGIEFSTTLMVLLPVYFVLGFLFFGSLMACIGALSTTMREAQNFVVFITLPAAIPMFFLPVFAEDPNGTIAKVLSMLPISASVSMVMRVSITDVPAGEILLSLALLVVGIFGAVWVAARLFRVNTLLAGTVPRLKDIPKLLRG